MNPRAALITTVALFSPICKSFQPSRRSERRSGSAVRVSTSPTIEDSDDTSCLFMEEDESEALSCFGTRDYWENMYTGCGDFPAEEYSWYYDWNEIKRHVGPYITSTDVSIFLPGIGNDSLLVDLIAAGYSRISAQDYASAAIDRQRDLLETVDCSRVQDLHLSVSDVKRLPDWMNESFDIVLEKGLLDAVYLSGPGNVSLAVASLCRTLKPGGIFVSVSGVVPDEARRELFANLSWLRDGESDLRAGCFVFQKEITK